MLLWGMIAAMTAAQDAAPKPEYVERQGVYDISFRNQPVAVNVLGADGSYIQIDRAGNQLKGRYELKGKTICYRPETGDESCWYETSRAKDGWQKMINRKTDMEIWVKRRPE